MRTLSDSIIEMLAYPQLAESVGQRFWRLVDKGAGDEACWPWQGSISGGYGKFKLVSYGSASPAPTVMASAGCIAASSRARTIRAEKGFPGGSGCTCCRARPTTRRCSSG